MNTPKKTAPKSKDESQPSPLHEYLAKPLRPYQRGTDDCCAFTAGWVNTCQAEERITIGRMTYGEAKRRIRQQGLPEMVAKELTKLGWTEENQAQDGDIVVYELAEALGGKAVGIMSEGAAVTRMEADKLHVTKEPKILTLWRISK